MTGFKRAALALLLLLTACGFSPVYGPHGAGEPAVADALSEVYIENIPNEHGLVLRNKLMDRLYFHGRPKNPQAYLSVGLSSIEAGLGIKKDATASMSELSLTAAYTLSDKYKKKIQAGTARSVVLYSKLDAQYGTLAAQRNAYERALNEVCEQLVNQLSLYYAEQAPLDRAANRLAPKKSWAFGHGEEAP